MIADSLESLKIRSLWWKSNLESKGFKITDKKENNTDK